MCIYFTLPPDAAPLARAAALAGAEIWMAVAMVVEVVMAVAVEVVVVEVIACLLQAPTTSALFDPAASGCTCAALPVLTWL